MNLDNPERFLENFKYGKYPMLMEGDIMGEIVGLKYDPISGKFKTVTGKTPKKEYDYVVMKKDGQYILIIGKRHSYLADWKNIEYGGRIEFTRKGKIEICK